MTAFRVDEPVWLSFRIADYVWRRVRAVPGEVYAAPGEGGRTMATFVITFVAQRADEGVDADKYEDKAPFVDFRKYDQVVGEDVTVARYRADDIRRILRRSGDK